VRARSLFERLIKEFPTASHAPSFARPASRAASSRALIAEDNDINAVIAHKALRRLGFDVTRARDGAEATRLAGAGIRGAAPRFDLILMDVKMPGLDGYETTRAIRALEREYGGPRVAIVVLTANAQAEDREASRNAGVDEFLAKPFELPRLADVIERALANSISPPEETRVAS
jgi:CheY-like chemotaxis protein